MDDLSYSSACTLVEAIQQKQLSAAELLEAQLQRIAEHNPNLNAIITLDVDGARRLAREADAALARGECWGALHGLPMTLKDCYETAGMRTTAGYPPLASYVPQADSTVAARVRAAGAIILGKTNVSERLLDHQSNNPIFGRTNNPWNLERTSGGSSGGAAAALAAGLTPLEIGSDIGGSIRNPAHFCGVYGLKPTDRRVPMTGHIPDMPGAQRSVRFLNGIGPMARSVEDLLLAFKVIAGPDGYDTEVAPLPVTPVPRQSLADLRIAWMPTFPGVPTAGAIRQAIEKLASELARAGGRVEEAPTPIDFRRSAQLRWELRQMVTKSFEAQPAEAQSATLAGFLTALHERDHFINAWDRFFATWDVLVCPVSMTTAFAHCPPGTPVPIGDTFVEYDDLGFYVTPFNLTGHPVVVVPLAHDQQGLPIGVQLVGPRWGDERLLAIAAQVDEITGGFRRPH